jgi:hypothetical protein
MSFASLVALLVLWAGPAAAHDYSGGMTGGDRGAGTASCCTGDSPARGDGPTMADVREMMLGIIGGSPSICPERKRAR